MCGGFFGGIGWVYLVFFKLRCEQSIQIQGGVVMYYCSLCFELIAFPYSIFPSVSDKEDYFWKIKRNSHYCAFMKTHVSQKKIHNIKSVYIPESERTYITNNIIS